MNESDKLLKHYKKQIALLEKENKELKEKLSAKNMQESTCDTDSSNLIFNALLDSTNDLLWTTDSKDFSISWFNKGLKDYFKKVGFELKKGMVLNEIFESEELIQTWTGYYKKAIEEKTFTTEYSTSNDNRILQLNFNAIKNKENRTTIAVFGKDITEQKNVEKALIEEIEFNDTLIQHSPAFIVAIDNNGKTIMMNQTMLDALGYNQNEVIGQDYLTKFVPEEDRADLLKVFTEIVQNEKITINENRVFKKNGGILECEWRGIPIFKAENYDFFFGVGIDISERKKAESALFESEEKYRYIVENAPIGIFQREIEGKYNYLNQTFLEHFECKSLKEFSQNYGSINQRWAHPEKHTEFKNLLLKNGFVKNYEVETLLVNGKTKWFSLNVHLNQSKSLINGFSLDITEQKNSEEKIKKQTLELNQAYQLQKMLFDETFQLIGQLSPDGKLLKANQTALKLIGLREEEVTNKFFWETPWWTHNADEQNQLKAAISKAVKGETVRFETNHHDQAGNQQCIDFSITPVFDLNKEVIFLIAEGRNISERKRMESDLIKNEAQLNALIDTIPDLVWFKDLKGVYLHCNQRFEQLFGALKNDIIGKTDYHFVDKQLADFFREKDINAIQAGKPTINEEKVVFASDRHIEILETIKTPVFNANKELIGVLGIGRDITQRKLSEEKLIESQRKLETLMANLPGLAYRCKNDSHWTMLFMSKGCYELTGFYPNELIDNQMFSFAELIHENYIEMVWQKVQSAIEHRVPWQMEYRIYTKNGEEKWVWEQGCGIYNEQGKVEILEGFITDISERKKLDMALMESQKNYEEIFNSTSDAIFINDIETGKIIDVNNTMLKMYGYSSKKEVLSNFIETSAIEEGFTTERAIELFNSVEIAQPLAFEWKAKKKNGENFWIEVSLKKTMIGGKSSILGTVRDISDRKKTELALRESEKRFHDAIQFQPIPIGIAVDDKIQMLNQEFTSTFGYTIDDIPTIDIWRKKAYPDPEYREQIMKIWIKEVEESKINDTSTPTYEYKITCKDGSVKWVEITGRTIGNLFIITFIDQTSRKLAEDEIKASEERYRGLYESMMDAYVLVDLSGKIIQFNHAYQEMLGYNKDELVLLTYNDITPKKWHKIENEIVVNQVFQTGYSAIYEKEYRKKNGTIFPIEIRTFLHRDRNGHPSGMWAIVRDITDRKKAEKELKKYQDHLELLVKERTKAFKESEKKFRLLFENSPDEIVISSMEGKVVDCNKAAVQFHGLNSKEELLKMPANEVYENPDDRKRIISEFMAQGFVKNKELKLRTLKGELRTMLVSIEGLKSSGNEPLMIAWHRDITERNKAQLELQLAKTEAEKANKSKSEFLSNMSHELRTPLNAILGFSKILKFQRNITENQKENLNTIYQCGEHLLSLINDILDMSKIESEKIELQESTINLMVLLQTAYNINKIKAIEKDLEFQMETGDEVPAYVVGDERKLKQIMLNLISNAIKFTKDGKISIKASYDHANNQFIFEVEDTGVGIPRDKQTEIFEPFSQYTGESLFADGTGLGLAITKKLVEFLNGTIELFSEPEVGSRFKITIPLKKIEYSERKTAPEILITGYKGNPRKILVVDDNQSNTSLLVSILTPIGFIVETAENGLLALESLKNFNPELILLDYRMPVMDGLEFIENLRKKIGYQSIKIIGISATLKNEIQKKQFQQKCNAFIIKPIDTDLLFASIKDLLNIEWIEEHHIAKKEPENMHHLQIPPKSIIFKIKESAEIGDINAINEIMIDLMEQDERYTAFCRMLQKHTRMYDRKAIIHSIDAIQNGKNSLG